MMLQTLMMMAALACGQEAPETPKAPEHPLERVAVIGASLTWGYGAHVPFRTPNYTHRELINFTDILEATLADDFDVTYHQSDILFFQRPLRTGTSLAAKAEAIEPTLLIAVDYLFWFGYGERDKEGRLHTGTESRLALLEEGLALLSTFDVPIIVSDFPDMRPAIGRVLKPTHVPSPEALDALNARLRHWADERDNVHVIPVSQLVDKLQKRVGFTVDELIFTDDDTATMLQQDALHPTAEGDLVIAQLVLRAVDAQSEAVDEGDYIRDPDLARRRLHRHVLQRLDPDLQAQPIGQD